MLGGKAKPFIQHTLVQSGARAYHTTGTGFTFDESKPNQRGNKEWIKS